MIRAYGASLGLGGLTAHLLVYGYNDWALVAWVLMFLYANFEGILND